MYIPTLSLIATTLLPLLTLAGKCHDNYTLPVRTIHEFPKGTWMENLAVRHTGSILPVSLSSPDLLQIDPSGTKEPEVLYTFPNVTSLFGITELSRDVFYVTAGNFSFAAFSGLPASYHIYRVAFDGHSSVPTVSLVTALPNLLLPNGLAAIINTPYILIADSIAGLVYRLNTETAELTTYFDDPLLKPSGTGLQGGVNGIKFHRGYFYFSNTNQELVARVPVTGIAATPIGEPKVVATQSLTDDFIVARNGDLFIAENAWNEVRFVRAAKEGNSTVPQTVVGSVNSTQLAGPTGFAWGRGENKGLFVSSNGGLTGYFTGSWPEGGRISYIDVSRTSC